MDTDRSIEVAATSTTSGEATNTPTIAHMMDTNTAIDSDDSERWEDFFGKSPGFECL